MLEIWSWINSYAEVNIKFKNCFYLSVHFQNMTKQKTGRVYIMKGFDFIVILHFWKLCENYQRKLNIMNMHPNDRVKITRMK